MPVHCPSCEAGVEAVSKFCLQCGHDLEKDGPITSTGHDVRQLKELIRSRDDLSMADKFDLIAKIEDGANPIELGLAASAESGGITPTQMEAQAAAPKVTTGSLSEAAQSYTTSPAAAAQIAPVAAGTRSFSRLTAITSAVSAPQRRVGRGAAPRYAAIPKPSHSQGSTMNTRSP